MRDLGPTEEAALAAMRPVFEAHDELVAAVEEMQSAFQKALANIAELTTTTEEPS